MWAWACIGRWVEASDHHGGLQEAFKRGCWKAKVMEHWTLKYDVHGAKCVTPAAQRVIMRSWTFVEGERIHQLYLPRQGAFLRTEVLLGRIGLVDEELVSI